MSAHFYTTIEGTSEGSFTNKGSKFIGYIFHITSEEEFKSKLKHIKSKHTGARHFCYAWRIGETELKERSNDDGEPSGTGGKPILNQLKSNDLTNAGLVVVRYFGGTLLGTSGLILSYKNGAIEAIRNAQVIKCEIFNSIKLVTDYKDYNPLIEALSRLGIKHQITESADDRMTIQLELPIRMKATLDLEIERLKLNGYTTINLL